MHKEIAQNQKPGTLSEPFWPQKGSGFCALFFQRAILQQPHFVCVTYASFGDAITQPASNGCSSRVWDFSQQAFLKCRIFSLHSKNRILYQIPLLAGTNSQFLNLIFQIGIQKHLLGFAQTRCSAQNRAGCASLRTLNK